MCSDLTANLTMPGAGEGSPAAPHLRLVGVLIFIAVVTSLRDPVLLAVLALAALGLGLASRLGWRFLLTRLGLVLASGVPFLLFTLVSQSGHPQALMLAALVGLRLLAAAASLIWLVGTLGERNLFIAFYSLGLPPLFVSQLLFTWRYFHVLAADVLSLRQAAAARGFVPGASLRHRHTFRTLGQLLGAFFLRSLARGERVGLAVAARSLGPCPPLAVARPGWQRRDLLPGLVMAGVAAILVWLDRGGLWLTLISISWR